MEKWFCWSPDVQIPGIMDHKSTCENEKELVLLCKDTDGRSIFFSFDNKDVLSYRETEEGNFLKTFNYLFDNYEETFFQDWAVFIIEDSKYLHGLKEENLDAFNVDVKHYIFYICDVVTEVLSSSPPSIKIEA